MSQEQWLEVLKRGDVHCRVLADDVLIDELRPTSLAQLGLPVNIRELGEIARGEYALEYRDFVESGRSSAIYTCAACKTIEKFGQALQFRQEFAVEFSRSTNPGAEPRTWFHRLLRRFF